MTSTSAASLATGQTTPVSHFALDNGMEVLVIPDRRAPVVTHMVYYRNGGADDPYGKSGIAHFLEHLMFKGTEKHPKGTFSQLIAELGGQENAFTGHDYTAYFQRVAKEHLGTMMMMETDRMAGLILSEEEVASEREVILEERKMHVENDPDSQLYESMSASLFSHHPYGKPIIGWMHEIKGLERADALAYYQRFYTPENATLVVSGDVSPEEVRDLANQSYGTLARRNDPPLRKRPQEPAPRTRRVVSLSDPKVEQPALYRLYLAPSHSTAQGNDSYALEVMSQLLGGSSVSLCYKALVVESGLAVNISTWFHGEALDSGRVGIHAVPAEGVSLEKLDSALDAVIDKLITSGVTDVELQRAKTRLIADLIYAQDNQASLARIYGAALCTGGTIKDIQLWPERIQAVTREDVIRVCRTYITRQNVVVGHLLQEAADAARQ